MLRQAPGRLCMEHNLAIGGRSTPFLAPSHALAERLKKQKRQTRIVGHTAQAICSLSEHIYPPICIECTPNRNRVAAGPLRAPGFAPVEEPSRNPAEPHRAHNSLDIAPTTAETIGAWYEQKDPIGPPFRRRARGPQAAAVLLLAGPWAHARSLASRHWRVCTGL